MIKCTQCNIEKPPSCFRDYDRKRNGKRSNCRECERKSDKRTPEQLREKTRKWRENNKDILPYSYRRWSLKTYYGLTEEEYNEKLSSQNGVCALCSSPPTTKNLAVDHCHSTDKIRGLLCANCNTALGLVKENTDILSKMIDYLRKHQNENHHNKLE